MLELHELNHGLPAITPQLGATLAQSAGVCLESQGHRQQVPFDVTGCVNKTYTLIWPFIDDQALRTWADLQEATEFGAMGIAVLLAKKELGYAAIERSAKGTGIDYWLGYEEEGPPFQNKARLEVSGILRVEGSTTDVEKAVGKRVSEKLKQTQPSSGSLPAYAIVVEFGTPLAEVQKT